MRRRVFITGGSGFIGANLIRKLLKTDQEVFALLRETSNPWRIKDILPKVHVVRGNLGNEGKLKKDLQRIKPDIIYHLATNGAYSYQNEAKKIFRTDIVGTFNLLNASKELELELFVNTGSSSEYGLKKQPMKETDLLEPNSFYAIAKAAQTHLCSYFAKNLGFPVITLRPFSVYGPYEQPRRLIPNIMKAFHENSVLKMVSKKIVRDFIYIDDYVDTCLKTRLLKNYPGEIFNLGSGRETSFSELTQAFQKIAGKEGSIEWGSFPSKEWDTSTWQADITKAKKFLKFKPKYSLESGLRKTWAWYKTHSFFYERD